MLHLSLQILPYPLAIYRLAADAVPPTWAMSGPFWSITRTADEISVVCMPQATVDAPVESGWRALQVVGPLAFSLTGIMASLTVPLGQAKVVVFVLSTFDTDYLLVKAADLPRATEVLVGAGHEVRV